MTLPRSRRTDVIVHTVGDELVVFDKLAAKAHNLNAPAAFVFRHADGETNLTQLAAMMAAELGTPADEELVEMSLQRLGRVGLLEQPFTPKAGPEKITRRQVMRRLGVAALAVPLITTIAAPTPAMAQSGVITTSQPNGGTGGTGAGGAGTGGAGTTGGSSPDPLGVSRKKSNGSCCNSDDDCLSGRCLDFGIGGLCIS